MEKKIYFFFERSTKLGISQFILAFFFILLSNILGFHIPDKLQIIILGSSFFIAFTLTSYDQTKIFGLKFRLIGLLSSVAGLLLIYSPIILFFYDNTDLVLWTLLILVGSILLTISIISDYYLIGIPEIVRAINYLLNFVKQVPEIIRKAILSFLKHIYLVIPFIVFILVINLGLNKDSSFIIVLSSVIFIAGILKVLLQYKPEIESRIRDTSNQAVFKISNFKWKFDSNINRYQCVSCKKPIKVTETTCNSCNNKITSCLICKLPLKEDSKRISCEICEYQFHRKHWDLWLDYRGSCPNCKTNYKPVIN
ncbi:MAG: hypothetical protein ACW981_07675 [Candidatus Hodarchaeales archaeon]|jgi:hypothetical protein